MREGASYLKRSHLDALLPRVWFCTLLSWNKFSVHIAWNRVNAPSHLRKRKNIGHHWGNCVKDGSNIVFFNLFILFLHLKRQSQAWSVMTLQICDLWWHLIKTIIIIIFNCHFHSAQQCIKTLERIFTMIIHVRRFINTSPTHRLMIFQESNFYQLPKK